MFPGFAISTARGNGTLESCISDSDHCAIGTDVVRAYLSAHWHMLDLPTLVTDDNSSLLAN